MPPALPLPREERTSRIASISAALVGHYARTELEAPNILLGGPQLRSSRKGPGVRTLGLSGNSFTRAARYVSRNVGCVGPLEPFLAQGEKLEQSALICYAVSELLGPRKKRLTVFRRPADRCPPDCRKLKTGRLRPDNESRRSDAC